MNKQFKKLENLSIAERSPFMHYEKNEGISENESTVLPSTETNTIAGLQREFRKLKVGGYGQKEATVHDASSWGFESQQSSHGNGLFNQPVPRKRRPKPAKKRTKLIESPLWSIESQTEGHGTSSNRRGQSNSQTQPNVRLTGRSKRRKSVVEPAEVVSEPSMVLKGRSVNGHYKHEQASRRQSRSRSRTGSVKRRKNRFRRRQQQRRRRPESLSESSESLEPEPTKHACSLSDSNTPRPSNYRNGQTENESSVSDCELGKFGSGPAPTKSPPRLAKRRRNPGKRRSRRTKGSSGPTKNQFEPPVSLSSQIQTGRESLGPETNLATGNASTSSSASDCVHSEVPQIKIAIDHISIDFAIFIKDYNLRIRGYSRSITKYKNAIDIKDQFLHQSRIRLREVTAESRDLMNMQENFIQCFLQLDKAVSGLRSIVIQAESFMRACFEITERINSIYENGTLLELYLTEEVRCHLGDLQDKMSLLRHRMNFAEMEHNIYQTISRFLSLYLHQQ